MEDNKDLPYHMMSEMIAVYYILIRLQDLCLWYYFKLAKKLKLHNNQFIYML